MLAAFKLIGVLTVLALFFGCGFGADHQGDSGDVVITYRDRIDIRSLADAEDHSIVIQATYVPIAENVELLVCVPRPENAPSNVKGSFNFSFYDGETMLVSTGAASVIREDKFETFFLYLNADFLRKLRVHMEYVDTEEFKATGDFVKSYYIYFDQIAAELTESQIELSHDWDPRVPLPEPSCFATSDE